MSTDEPEEHTDTEDQELADDTAKTASEGAVDELPSTRLLGFYDRLRERIVQALEGRKRLGSGVADALLLVPDVFILTLRLALDKDVPKATRTLLASTLAYFVLPFDLIPEGVVGPTGYLDDLVLALMVLSRAFGAELEPFAQKYWSGSENVRKVLSDALEAASTLVGVNVYERLSKMLAKQGIKIDRRK